MSNSQEAGKRTPHPLIQAGLLTLLVVLGLGVRSVLGTLRSAPPEAKGAVPALTVEAITVQPEDVPVSIRGLGEVRPVTVLPIAAAVAGELVEVHPRLEVGEVIPSGEVLFRVDPRDYEASVAEAEANVLRAVSSLSALKLQSETDRQRLETAARTRALALNDFERVKALSEDDLIVSESALSKAESDFNEVDDEYKRIEQAVSLYPHQIKEATGTLSAARAQLAKARSNLERTVRRAPFHARVVEERLEQGQYVAPGANVLTLADDSLLEIAVPLDSGDAREWLRFKDEGDGQGPQWYGTLEPVSCRVAWTEDPGEHAWEGTVSRIEKFDRQSRTVIVAVQVQGDQVRAGAGQLPLAEGMFCSVEIPGKTMRHVYQIPRWSVTFNDRVFVAEQVPEEGGVLRLADRAVKVVRTESQTAYVGAGLNPGDRVIVTRLANPMRGALLDVVEREAISGQRPAETPATPGEDARP